jgi:hypothetical protein
LTLACLASILVLLLILAMAVPVDFTKWTALFLVLFLIIFTYAVGTIIAVHFMKVAIMHVAYSIVATTVLSIAMLLNLQVLFNGAIFELYPDDFILGAILMFADVM